MKKIAWLITGSMSAISTPGILHSLRAQKDSIEIDPFLTESATRIVAPSAVSTLAGRIVQYDRWTGDSSYTPKHISLEQEYDAFVVAPATLNFLTKFIFHDCSTPFFLALQCTKKPIIVAPGLPPGGLTSVAYRRVEREIKEWSNLSFLSPISTISASDPHRSSAGLGDPSRLIKCILKTLID